MSGQTAQQHPDALNLAAQQVLARYVLPDVRSVLPFGNCGGFSGATLWRVEHDGGPLVLRAWPSHDPSRERLCWLTRLQVTARAAGLSFVPELFVTAEGAHHVCHADRLWSLETWLSGSPIAGEASITRVAASCRAVAQLHGIWARSSPAQGVCPGILRRLERLADWQVLLQSGWRPGFLSAIDNPFTLPAQSAWSLLPRWVERAPDLLAPFAKRVVPLHPCLCDVWCGNVLFEGERVSGIVDYGSAKFDHPAVDLARLLGSFGDDPALWAAGLEAYAQVRPLAGDEEALTRVLDTTGCVVAAINWLRWIYQERREFSFPEAVADRLTRIVRRLQL